MFEEKILQSIRIGGPTFPSKTAKVIGTDSILASAYLSDLTSKGKLLITNARAGESPLYYIKGQESRMELMIYPNLNEREKKAFDRLKSKGILLDSRIDPSTRATLGELKDFARPLRVKRGDKEDTFWAWYKLSKEEVVEKIKILFEPRPEIIPKEQITPAAAKSDEKRPPVTDRCQEVQKDMDLPSVKKKESVDTGSKKETGGEMKKESIKNDEKISAISDESSVPCKKRERQRRITKGDIELSTEEKSIELKSAYAEDPLFNKVDRLFKEKGIRIRSCNVIRKGSDINMVISVPTAIGAVEYYCKAKGKKRCNNTDVMSAIVEGQLQRLPILFLYGGDITKNASLLLNEDFKNLIILKLEDGN